ncbi:MAG TPA: FtsX-like permease family protein [Terriglobales bacterium]|jgi:putative ABC transport system permease protein
MFTALIWRPLRNDLGRTLLSVLAIALGVAVVIAIRVANRSAIASFQQSTAALAGGADLLVTGPQPLPASLLPKLFPLNAQAEILPYLDRRAYDPQSRDTLEVLGVDLLAGAGGDSPAGSASATSARDAPPEGSILVPADYAQRHDLHAGGTLTLTIGGEPHRFPIGAVLPATSIRAGAGAGDIAILDLQTALAAFEPGALPMFDGLRVTLAPGAQRDYVASALRSLVPAADTVAPPRFQGQQAAKMLAAFRANLEALAYVALLIGIFLIYNTVSISVVRRRAAIATVRALGATRRRVQALFLAEGMVLALAGGLVGWALGWLLARTALVLVQATVNSLYAPTHPAALALSGGDLAWALGLAAGAGALAAWAPARQAAHIAPAAALRPGGAETSVRLRHAWGWLGAAAGGAAALTFARLPEVAGLPLFGFASALAAVLAVACLAPPVLAMVLPRLRRALLRRGHVPAGIAAGSLAGALRRSSILTAALAIAMGVMLGVAIMVGSFRQTVQIWIGQQLQADVFVRAPDWDRDHPTPLAPSLIAAISSTPGMAGVDASHTQAWTYLGQPIFVNTRWKMRGTTQEAELHFLSGGSGGVVVSEPFARRFHLWPGDRFTLAARTGPVALQIAGVFYDYASDRGQVVLAPGVFTRAFGTPAPTEIALFAAPGTTPAALRHALEAQSALSGLVINDNRSLRAEAMRVFDQTFRITYALEVITLLVAVLGVANTLLAITLERSREFALLRLLGATRRQILDILLAESAFIATAALVLGAFMGGVLALILVRVINVQSFGWTIQFHPPYAFLIPAAAAVWVATLAAGWLPARAAQRQATPAALGAE